MFALKKTKKVYLRCRRERKPEHRAFFHAKKIYTDLMKRVCSSKITWKRNMSCLSQQHI